MGSALDVFPGEVWLRIIGISCADTSFTARTLSLVSRDIYKLTKPYRVQSVSLLGVSRIFGFYKTLTSSPENFSRVVHLFIGCPNLRQENEWLRRYTHRNLEVFAVAAELLSATGTQDSDAPASPPDSITEVVLGGCIQRILTLVGTSLKHLHLHFIGFGAGIKLLPNFLPYLERLVLYGPHAPYQIKPEIPLRLPSLKRLKIGYHNSEPSRMFPKLGTLFPALVEFTLIQATIPEVYFSDLLDMIKRLDALWPESERVPREVIQRKLILEVDTVEGLSGGGRDWYYKELRNVAATTHRVEIVQKEWQFTDLQKAETDWVLETREWVGADWAADSL